MRIYLDISCLNRPFDDQRQKRVRRESDTIFKILARIDSGEWSHVSFTMAIAEIMANPDLERRRRILMTLPAAHAIIEISNEIFRRGEYLQRFGLAAADALHVAAAEAQKADAFLTCDDKLVRAVRRHADRFLVKVENPVAWMRDYESTKDKTS